MQTLIDTIRRERRYGVVHCIVEDVQDGATAAIGSPDSFVGRHGMKQIGDGWVEVPFAAAHQHLTAILHRDMAYQHEIMPRDRAGELAGSFLALFPNARFYTNSEAGPYDPPASRPWSWGSDPLTDATLDTGIVAIAGKRVGMLWIEDED